MEDRTRKITCLQVHNDYQVPGGETKTAEGIASLLESYGIKVIRYYKSNNEFKEAGIWTKVRVGFRSIYNKCTVEEISKILKRENVDFALIHNVMPVVSNSVYEVLQEHGIPIIKYIQNYNLICLNGALDHGNLCKKCSPNCFKGVVNGCYKNSRMYSFVKYIVKYKLDQNYLPHVAAFMPNSNYVKNIHREFGLNVENFFVMHNYIDVEDINWNYSNYDSYYLYFGRISREKGIFTAIGAFKDIADSQLIIMGTGEAEDELIKSLVGCNNVNYIGGKSGEEVKSVIKKAKCVIVPSEWDEPLPRTILEAYACGMPVIGANRGGIPEMIKENETGYIYHAGDVDDLKAMIRTVNSLTLSQYNNMRKKCLNECKKRYSRESYYFRFISCLEKLRI